MPDVVNAAVPAAVAAGDVSTAAVGAQVLQAGGSAADAAVAAMLAACAGETMMTGLGGGGFATYWDAATRTATSVDFFVAVPGKGHEGPVAPMREIHVQFGPQRLEFYIGAASVAVPGVVPGLGEVHRRWGRLPWTEVVAPAYGIARDGVSLSAQKAVVLADIREGMTSDPEGVAAYAPHGRLLRAGERLFHRGLADAYAAVRDEGPDTFRTGAVAASIVDIVHERGGALTAQDLAAYAVDVRPARTVPFAGHAVHGRTDLIDLLGTLHALPDGVGQMSSADRAVAWVRALLGPQQPLGTTNLCVVDAEGDACAVTTSLGLGSGDWAPGYGVHLNSMLGEGELMIGTMAPGDRVSSMMCPVVATDDTGLALVAGAAGGSRIRSALVQTITGVLAEGCSPQEAVDRARLNPVRADFQVLVHAEPEFPADALAALAGHGYAVQHWDTRSAYFGGVSMVGRDGAAADPRRDGAVAYA